MNLETLRDKSQFMQACVDLIDSGYMTGEEVMNHIKSFGIDPHTLETRLQEQIADITEEDDKLVSLNIINQHLKDYKQDYV